MANQVAEMACLLSFASLFFKNSNAFFFNLDKMDSEKFNQVVLYSWKSGEVCPMYGDDDN